MAGRKYRNPPIDEATCQFTLAEPVPWDAAVPRRLFDRFKGRYPAMPTQQQLLQANLAPATGVISPSLSLVQNERVVFLTEDGTDRLSVGPENIGVHRAPPYVGFEEELLPRIREQLPEVLQVLGCEPAFAKVAVRYVNKITINKAKFDLEEYFTHWGATSALPDSFEGDIGGFFYRIAGQRAGRPDSLVLTFASLEAPKKDAASFLLDIDLTRQFSEAAGTDKAIEEVIALKALENSIFESLITDKCRDLFE
jgi:uncharacterized protein (TIGR04255 family)